MESRLISSLLDSIGEREKAAVLEFRDSLMIKIVDSAVALIQRWRTVEGRIYVGEGGRMAIVGFSGNPPKDLEKEVRSSMTESPFFFEVPRNEREVRRDASDGEIKRSIANPEGLIGDLLNMMVERTSGVVTLEAIDRQVATSGGFLGMEELTTFTSHFRVFKGEHTGHWSTTGSQLNINEMKAAIRRAEEYASINDEVEIDEGRHRVMLSPMVFSNLLQLVGRMASAMSVEMGSSIFTKARPGDKMFSPLLTIFDKPLSDVRPVFFDDEGVITYDKAIVEGGEFKTLLFNTALAKRRGTSSTGNAGWMNPSPWNLEVAAGETSEEGVLDGDGVLFTNNWYTRLQNSMEGIFSTVGRDAILLIRNGKVVGRSRGRLRLAGRLGDLLKNVEAVSRTQYPIRWWEVETPTKAPFVAISSFPVTKSQ